MSGTRRCARSWERACSGLPARQYCEATGFSRLPGPRNLSVESLYKILAQGDAKLIRRGIARQHFVHRAQSVTVRLKCVGRSVLDFQILDLFQERVEALLDGVLLFPVQRIEQQHHHRLRKME